MKAHTKRLRLSWSSTLPILRSRRRWKKQVDVTLAMCWRMDVELSRITPRSRTRSDGSMTVWPTWTEISLDVKELYNYCCIPGVFSNLPHLCYCFGPRWIAKSCSCHNLCYAIAVVQNASLYNRSFVAYTVSRPTTDDMLYRRCQCVIEGRVRRHQRSVRRQSEVSSDKRNRDRRRRRRNVFLVSVYQEISVNRRRQRSELFTA